MLLHDKINDAITNYLTVMHSYETLQEIKAIYGVDTASLIDDITTSVTNDIIWSGSDDSANYQVIMERLTLEYPYLTKASRLKIADIAAYFWKSVS